jgi:hypothetical protein
MQPRRPNVKGDRRLTPAGRLARFQPPHRITERFGALAVYMTTTCPCCGLTLTEAAARCPLCNERLVRIDLRVRHVLSALLALEICVALLVLT